ncbi:MULTISPECIES: pre-peptidase C-terminal domain-containing protein [unclassified Leptolyngbya]|uniref:pre-peptidase C-terminal domain-containing protein n=1 Tax=unclassified Leptolyngbya TaxID=2650499 RepID=UPI0016858AF5|nr:MULTISPECIES: pre-peptidase C-terminal domain-containing protein [unclassified Leptolyngbya]MBD1914125.1 pre-peptidase C-terminal domain-containing protein [Leptolyngbya sp. FACHB-8]MBD2158722.1 pre-peptidase C-terminal domain-containing protein [Leptolyngbya sp. FACHB-16]
MTRMMLPLRALGVMGAIATLAGSACFSSAALAQTPILEREGSLRSLQGEHVYNGTAGQRVAISLTSTEFDGALTLLSPNGTELATNEDYARSQNPTIIITLPSTGAYKILARSSYGQAGSYTVNVRPATAYDEAYARGVNLVQSGNFLGAIDAFREATQADPNQPVAYLDMADALYTEATRLRPEEARNIVANYNRAADLYAQQGNTEMAQMLREQASYLEQSAAGGL